MENRGRIQGVIAFVISDGTNRLPLSVHEEPDVHLLSLQSALTHGPLGRRRLLPVLSLSSSRHCGRGIAKSSLARRQRTQCGMPKSLALFVPENAKDIRKLEGYGGAFKAESSQDRWFGQPCRGR